MPVSPRATREDFLRDLGLSWDRATDKSLYIQMRDEAIRIYEELQRNRANLKAEQYNDPNIGNPFYWHHLKPEVQIWAIQEVWARASPETKPLYDRGATAGEHGPNAVTRWLLYSVFRSRDERNDRNRRNRTRDGRGDGTSGGAATLAAAQYNRPNNSSGEEGRRFYDAARNGYR